MDVKKAFEYEYALQNQRPDFSMEESYIAALHPEKISEATSFNVTHGAKEGVFIKFASKDGVHSKLAYMNPIMARALANELLEVLAAQGFGPESEAELSTNIRTYH